MAADVFVRILAYLRPRRIKDKGRIPAPLRPLVSLYNGLLLLFEPVFIVLEVMLRIIDLLVTIFEMLYVGVIKTFWKILWGLTLGPFVGLARKRRRGAQPPEIKQGRAAKSREKILKALKWR